MLATLEKPANGNGYMQLTLALIVLLSVFLSSGSQVLLKFGMSSPEIASALANDGPLRLALAIAASPPVVMGLACFALSAVVWLFVLSKLPLSTAYPFVALGIAISVAAGRFLFNEPISTAKLIGVSLIIVGVGTVAASS
jgi:multidrug transporter EmrE-like cation transporter